MWPDCNRCLFPLRFAEALNIRSFEGSAHRCSILLRCEKIYLPGVTLLPTINTCWPCSRLSPLSQKGLDMLGRFYDELACLINCTKS